MTVMTVATVVVMVTVMLGTVTMPVVLAMGLGDVWLTAVAAELSTVGDRSTGRRRRGRREEGARGTGALVVGCRSGEMTGTTDSRWGLEGEDVVKGDTAAQGGRVRTGKQGHLGSTEGRKTSQDNKLSDDGRTISCEGEGRGAAYLYSESEAVVEL